MSKILSSTLLVILIGMIVFPGCGGSTEAVKSPTPEGRPGGEPAAGANPAKPAKGSQGVDSNVAPTESAIQ